MAKGPNWQIENHRVLLRLGLNCEHRYVAGASGAGVEFFFLLVLQPHLWGGASGRVVAAAGAGLVPASPA